jgi:hypothetical protein
MTCAEAPVQDVKVAHAIEERKDCGVRSHRRRERTNRAFQVIGLTGEQHKIRPLMKVFGNDGCWIGDRDIAETALDYEAGSGKFRRLDARERGK